MAKFLLRNGTKKYIVHSCNVEVIIARGRNTELVEIDPVKKIITRRHNSSYNLGYYKKRIAGSELIKCHHSFIVNKNFIIAINGDNTLDLLVSIGESISIARRAAADFKTAMGF